MEHNEQNQPVQEPMVEPVARVDQPMKKPSSSAVWLLVIVLVIVMLLIGTSKMSKNDMVTEVPQDENTEMLCYYGSAKTASGYNDTYALKLAITGSNATGELMTAPAEKDTMTGSLSGTIIPAGEERIFDGSYSNMAEGMNNIDQRIIRLTDTAALIGYGDVTENADGSYSYTDPNNINFSLKIPAVDCALYDQAMAI